MPTRGPFSEKHSTIHQRGQKANPTAPISRAYDTKLFQRNGSRKIRNANTVNTIKVTHSCTILSCVKLK